jgi:uncharacterized membrane protein
MVKSKKVRNPHHTATPPNDLRARKKEAVIGRDRKKASLLPIVMAVVLVAAIAGGYTLYIRSSDSPSSAASAAVSPAAALQPGAGAATDPVAYPVSLFEDGQARHFEFQDGGRTIRYFVIKSADGILRAAFDACDVCWPAGQGYYQEGDTMVCRNCGRKFASNLVNEVQGGCNPAPLTRKVENDMLVIHPDDIRGGAGYFDFKGKV